MSGRVQAGLSLIELMIAMLLASIITSAAIAMLVTDSQTSRFQINQTSAHTSGRFAFDFILADLRKAGYSSKTVITQAVEGDNNIALNNSDVLRIRYDAALAQNRDCVGNAIVSADPAHNAVVNEYRIEQIGDDHVLTCNGNPLMTGVDGFQVLFGVDSNAADTNDSPDSYVCPGAQQPTDKIVTVQIAMLIATLERGGENVEQQYQLLDEDTGVLLDGRGRTLFTTTERIRNVNLENAL